MLKKDMMYYKQKADQFICDLNVCFDHYGIKTPDSKTYESLKKELGDLYNEVSLGGRNIATVIDKEDVYEIMEPKPDETVSETIIDHVSYRSENYNELRSNFDEVLSEFEFGKTKGFKIEKAGLIVEFRNNKLTDSLGDI